MKVTTSTKNNPPNNFVSEKSKEVNTFKQVDTNPVIKHKAIIIDKIIFMLLSFLPHSW